MYLVSACLLGVNCKYNGKNNLNSKVVKLFLEGKAIALCPEVLGGLETPRKPCEIVKINGQRKVLSQDGQDYSQNFQEGAEKTLEVIKSLNIKKAILQKRSPSCGYQKIYDGTFSDNLIEGHGFTADLLLQNGIELLTVDDLEEL